MFNKRNRRPTVFTGCMVLALLMACRSGPGKQQQEDNAKADTAAIATGEKLRLPAPYATPSVTNYCTVIGWPQDKTPVAPQGFRVSRFAEKLDNPRWIYVAPSGDVFVSEASSQNSIVKQLKNEASGKSGSGNSGLSANRILLLRDVNHDGRADEQYVFLSGLKQPFGMLIRGNSFYVANTDGIVQYPYLPGQTSITAKGKKILELPAEGYNNHWTRNILLSKDSAKIYVTVGSGSNNAEHGIEHETRRANILEINPDGTGEIVYASGLRNPQGMGWAPGTDVLWTSVNERDELGDSLVPDYLTSVKKNGFYGWPYAYFGQHEDPRMKGQRPDLVAKALVPDVALGAHTASLGLAFDEQQQLPGKYKGGAFIGQHGSWNASRLTGYEVAFVPFHKGKPAGGPEHFLTGFIADSSGRKVYGRPVGLAFTQNNALLVADDAGNTIWQVSEVKK